MIWKLPLPEECKIFNWFCYNNRVLTWDVLNKKGMKSPSKCSLCGSHSETSDHLFVSCLFTKKIWSHLLPHTPILDEVQEFWHLGRQRHVDKKFLKASDTLIAIALWCIWVECDYRTFRCEALCQTTVVKKIIFLFNDLDKELQRRIVCQPSLQAYLFFGIRPSLHLNWCI